MDPDRRYEISGSETNDSLLLSAIAAARVSPFVLVLLSPSSHTDPGPGDKNTECYTRGNLSLRL